MTDYQKYINALRKCAKEHEKDTTSIGHIVVSDLCRDTANLLEQVKQESVHCKDCKQWKDSDGVYRRGVGAESSCPINHKEVYEGNGYCFLFEPQEKEKNDKEMTENKEIDETIKNDNIIDITENMEHEVSELMCMKCLKRWIGVYPVATLLKDIECECGEVGFVIKTGQMICEESEE